MKEPGLKRTHFYSRFYVSAVYQFKILPYLAALTDNLLNQVTLNLILLLVNQGSLGKYVRVNVLASQFCSSSKPIPSQSHRFGLRYFWFWGKVVLSTSIYVCVRKIMN